jgi:AraC-like DNA-binding protein
MLRAIYQSQTFARHTHETYTLGMVLGGAGTFYCRGAEHFAGQGDIVVIPPEEMHTGAVASGFDTLSYLAIYLPVDLAVLHCESADLVGGGPPEFGAVVLRDPIVRRAFNGLNAAIATGTLDSAGAEAAACTAITELIRLHAEPRSLSERSDEGRTAEPRVVGIVRDAIHDCYAAANETSLQMLAERAGVTPFRVIRAFRQATGLAPHQYLIQVRVERARQLLAAGAIPSMAALHTGFVDQSHLTHHFKRYLGITPANYQRCVITR